MSAKRSGDATLRDTTRALALLSTDAAAVKGLQAVIKAGRRQGLDTVQIAGVTLTSAAAAAGSKRSQQRNGGCASGTRDQAEPSKRSRRKSQAQRERDAEKFRDKRMRKKLLPVLRLVNKVMSESALQQEQTMQLAASTHSGAELPQFSAEHAPKQSSHLLEGPQVGQMVQMEQGGKFRPKCPLSAETAAPQQQPQHQQQGTQLMEVESGQRTPRGTQRERQSPGSGAPGSGKSGGRAKKKVNFNAAHCPSDG